MEDETSLNIAEKIQHKAKFFQERFLYYPYICIV